jgi:hypothetical protein
MTVNIKWLGTDSYLDAIIAQARQHNLTTPELDKVFEALETHITNDDKQYVNNVQVEANAFLNELQAVDKAGKNGIGHQAALAFMGQR